MSCWDFFNYGISFSNLLNSLNLLVRARDGSGILLQSPETSGAQKIQRTARPLGRAQKKAISKYVDSKFYRPR